MLAMIFGMTIKIFAGFFAVISPFTWLFVAASLAAAFLLSRRFGRVVSFAVVSLGSMALWVSLFVSTMPTRQAFPLDPYSIKADAGFPLTAFRYPHPPMGHDVPPYEMWPAFFVNYVFWLALAFIAVRLLRPRIVGSQKALAIIGVAMVLVNLYGLGDTLLKFD